MPQMSPIWWTTLFLYFIILLFMSNTINYFIYYPSMKKKYFKLNMTSINWKW
uniref:ATP synthase complex subunit 8 n=1 Tax=Stimulopalpus japonicus TaxID=209965 RepID=A0A343QCJ0_9NEOP|nr:ATP synthase F0 subunit 8 [Stimulopalpus japonicus]ATU07137.1 ATP synthase F0 subunit 8 [Stimulopalpus japonicus]